MCKTDTLVAETHSLMQSHQFSGVIRLDRKGETLLEYGYGLAQRALNLPNTPQTQFGIASGTKTLTALVIISLIAEGKFKLQSRVRALLSSDLPFIADEVTIEHLLSHRSGIGDYLDENDDPDLNDYLMPVPVHRLVNTLDYLPLLDAKPMKFSPGEQFAYCNSGFVVLALIAERCTGLSFANLVRQRVTEPAGMSHTAFLRSDELPALAALGYLSDPQTDRTNVLHLPVRGSGDGGIYSTAGDIHRLWDALLLGRIVDKGWVDEMLRPRSTFASGGGYGLGLWHGAEGRYWMMGADAGVGFASGVLPAQDFRLTLLSNVTEGTDAVFRDLSKRLLAEVN
ncbi:serine hydrolase domain-containing protein [Deinococcus cavernae]|nr:serine hydrolase domain-containing protein [Deinococcus cavernae]